MYKRSLLLLGCALSSSAATAGVTPTPEQPKTVQCGDWCSSLKSLGTPLYKSDTNPYIQSVKFKGRLHLHYAYIDGEDVNGQDFNESFTEIRRFRVGTSVKFLNKFKLTSVANWENDRKPQGGDRDIEFSSFDEFNIEAKLSDSTSIVFGRQKVVLGNEVNNSSKRIKTFERSAIANRVYPAQSTGIKVKHQLSDRSKIAFGFYDNEAQNMFSDFEHGYFVTAHYTTKLNDGSQFRLEGLYNFEGNDANFASEVNGTNTSLAWAISSDYQWKSGRWEYFVNGIVGENAAYNGNNRDGLFYGLVGQASYWILEDKLDAVFQYSYFGSEESQGVRTNSRYFRRNHSGNVNSGRGDQLHSIYAGVSYYFCGERTKVLAGVTYEDLDTPSGSASALTYSLGFRLYF